MGVRYVRITIGNPQKHYSNYSGPYINLVTVPEPAEECDGRVLARVAKALHVAVGLQPGFYRVILFWFNGARKGYTGSSLG